MTRFRRTFAVWALLTTVAITTTQGPLAWSGPSPAARAPIGSGPAAGTKRASHPPEAVAPVKGVSSDWWSQAQESLRRSEYDIRQAAEERDEAYHATNRAHDLRLRFGSRGVEFSPRVGRGVNWSLTLAFLGIDDSDARGGTPAAGQLSSSGHRVAYERPGHAEWWVNDERGIEHGFTLYEAPSARAGEWRVRLQVEGDLRASLIDSGAAVEFFAGPALVLRYAGLRVVDAAGRELPAHLDLRGCEAARVACELGIVVDAAGARYPVVVDPLVTTPSWSYVGLEVSGYFGWSVAAAGDVNGDGFADIIVGAPYYYIASSSPGAAFVFHGSPAGPSITPSWTATGGVANWGEFGQSVAGAGDVNGDGYDDVIVGAPTMSAGQTGEGMAFVYTGSATGLSPTASWSAQSDQTEARLGASVASAGDVNSDGFADVIVGAYKFDNSLLDEGAAFVYHGSAAGLSVLPQWAAEGQQAAAEFGSAVSGCGDVNADGFGDVIIGAPKYDNGPVDEGRAMVYLGSPTGLAVSPQWTSESDQQSSNYGLAVSGAGDVNGDGYADVVVGAPRFGVETPGRVWLFTGSGAGVQPLPAVILTALSGDSWMGGSVSAAGDVNGDGYGDVVVGVPYGGANGGGRALLYQGSAQGLVNTPASIIDGTQQAETFGTSVAGAGDVNGDGFADVIVGAPGYFVPSPTTGSGRATTYYGAASGLTASPVTTVAGSQAGASLGAAVAFAGDVNGDGFGDVAVGAPGFDAGQVDEGRVFVFHGASTGLPAIADWTAESNQAGARFGGALASAGDVNGDGYSDLLIGAARFDNGEADEGRAFVYHGSSAGLAALPAWTAESNQAGAEFGAALSGAGDVNGDGFTDVVVGAPLYDGPLADEGRTFAFHGSAAGLAANAAWTGEGDQFGARYGTAVASAGDVNGDGFADVIVGAPRFDNGQNDEGRAFVHHGSTAGLGISPAWLAEGNQASAHFGAAVAGAGDLDGDGYADALVGAPQYDGGAQFEGRAFAFRGSSAGLGATPIWTAESNQADARFGAALAGAGDVNGDGYADVVIGAPLYESAAGQADEGRAYLYRGASSGLAAAPEWSVEGEQPGANLGVAVSAAGDVNGDGFADVVVGAGGHDSGPVDDGRAYVFGGNGGAGRRVQARQVRGGDSTRAVQPWGHSYDVDGLNVRLLGTASFGRARLKLEVEACPTNSTFGQSACSRAVGDEWFDTGGAPGGVSLVQRVPLLTGGKLYRWRARVLHAPLRVTQAGVIAPRSPAHGPWRRVAVLAQEADVRVGRGVEADLSVTKTDQVPSTTPGAVLNYTIVASNAGPAATTAQVTDAFPPSLTCSWTCAASAGAACTAGPVNGAISDTASLPAGATATYAATCAVSLTASGTITNTASVAGIGLPDPNPANNSATDVDLVVTTPSADLAITKSDGVSSAVPGSSVTYTLSVTNAGPENVTGATVLDVLPAAFSGGVWSCVPTPGSTCTGGPTTGGIHDTVSLLAGGSLTYTLIADVASSASGSLVNTAVVFAPQVSDPARGNNVATDTDTLTPQADLRVSQTDSRDPVAVYSQLTYTVTTTNHGPSDATDVTLVDTLPAGFTYVLASPGCAFATGVVTCELGDLPRGAARQVSVTVAAGANVGPVQNQAAVSGAEPDPLPANNAGTETTLVRFVKGDLDGDLRTDLLLRNGASGQNLAWLMDAATLLTPVLVTPDPDSLDWSVAGVDDFNGDKRNDLVLWNSVTGAVQFWPMGGRNGTDRIGAVVNLLNPPAPPWRLVATADFNADGNADLVWLNGSTQVIEIWTMQGTTQTGTITPFPAQAGGASWEVVAALDFNGDTFTDFVWYNAVSGNVVLWFMDANVQRIIGIFTNPPSAGGSAWKVRAAGDYGVGPNGLPGTTDLVWRNSLSGKLVIWYMDQNGNRTNGSFTTPDAPPNALSWTVVGPR